MEGVPAKFETATPVESAFAKQISVRKNLLRDCSGNIGHVRDQADPVRGHHLAGCFVRARIVVGSAFKTTERQLLFGAYAYNR